MTAENGSEARPVAPSRPAFDLLAADDWHVAMGRRLIAEPDIPTGALLALAAVCAWRDRGPAWGGRVATETPPGGWAALIGGTRETWRSYRNMALDMGLIGRRRGKPELLHHDDIPLLAPLVEAVEEGEQFARAPAAVIFDASLALAPKRLYLALALHANEARMVRVSLDTLATVTGFDRRRLQRARARLEAGSFVLARHGRKHAVTRYQLTAPESLFGAAAEFDRLCRLQIPGAFDRDSYGT